jgi:NADPH:quinone reductase
VLVAGGAGAVGHADAGDTVALPTLPNMLGNTRFQFVFTYLTPRSDKLASVRAVSAAVADGAMPVGAEHGLPVRHYPLERTGEAHRDSEGGAVGKLLIDVTG